MTPEGGSCGECGSILCSGRSRAVGTGEHRRGPLSISPTGHRHRRRRSVGVGGRLRRRRRPVDSTHGFLPPHLLPHRRHRPLRLLLRVSRASMSGRGCRIGDEAARQRIDGSHRRGPRGRRSPATTTASILRQPRHGPQRHRPSPSTTLKARPGQLSASVGIELEKPPYRPGGRTEGSFHCLRRHPRR